jgi:NAD dependent epimerase/dehydratase
MKKVLITGAGGFIGSHLTEMCVEQGFKVKAFVHYNSNNHWGWLEQSPVLKKIEVVTGDIRDYDAVVNATKGCDVVFHLAALIGIPYSYLSPLAYIRTNIEGTYNVVQAAREEGVKKVLVTSTSETYGTAQYVPINENHPAVGQSPYAATKIGADQLALSYYRSFGLPVTVVRPFNTYGPRQSARAIIPTIITQVLSGQNTIKLGNLTPTRDLTFVKDTAMAFLAVAVAKNTAGKVINVGMNEEISIADLVALIGKVIKKDIKISTDQQRLRIKNSEVERLRCDNTLIKELTEWLPAYNLERGLRETTAWIKQHLSIYKSEIYNV